MNILFTGKKSGYLDCESKYCITVLRSHTKINA